MTSRDDGKKPLAMERSAEALKESSERVDASTHKMTASTERMKDSADRRTELAANRTVLASERTYAAWIRTGLASLASGIGAKKLLEGVVPEWMIIATGSVLILFSAQCFIVAVWRELSPGAPPPEPDTRRLPPALLILSNGFLTLVALAALMSIWFGRTGGH
jgi:putative membrane protein